jgi:diguanylate cyclase (GGDEF)-like protein/PAS domain S-box-containing protein
VSRAIGLEAGDLVGSRAFEGIVHPDDLAGISGAFAAAVQDSGATVSIAGRVRHEDGSWRTLEGTIRNLLGDPAVAGLVINCRDVTERKQAEEMIEHLAYHDALTDLPNRTLLKDRLTVALAHGRRKGLTPAVLFLDLDEFKVVNDTVGHAEGDRLLQQVAEELTGLLRDGDTVARMGGDEFTLVLPEVACVEDAVEVAARVLQRLRRPWLLHGQEFHVTASIGIAIYPGDGEDAETLLRNADTAMYGAKKKGRDNYQLYTPEMNARIAERLALENSLRRGLELGEFVVHYQPQVNISTGQVVGVEALVRWQHPERGLILPGEFISLAEETGLIVRLGEWVLRTACAQNKAWQEAGLPPIRVAVNLSVRQFQERGLMDTVSQVLRETGLDPAFLQLEITEGAAMDDADFTITTLRNLREIGVQIAIDDFGTGHSSLAYLKRFPIDVVKIDRSFVRNLTIDATDAAIATTVIAMARSLKLQVIAEGVETEEQLAFLRAHDCDEMQGYLFAKAVPALTLQGILAQGKSLRAPADVPG